MYSICLSLALAADIFLVPKTNVQTKQFQIITIKRIILVCANITTFSTTGIVVLISIILLYYLTLHTHTQNQILLKLMVGIIVMFIGSTGVFTVLSAKASSVSWFVRMNMWQIFVHG